MHHVAFSLVSDEVEDPTIRIDIRGRSLREWARDVELPFAKAAGNSALAGSYHGLTLDDVDRDRRHFLGSPVATHGDNADTILLGCVCGIPDCWPLTANVAVTETEVVWDHFRTGHSDWDLGYLGPFAFDRDQYEAALDAVLPRFTAPL